MCNLSKGIYAIRKKAIPSDRTVLDQHRFHSKATAHNFVLGVLRAHLNCGRKHIQHNLRNLKREFPQTRC